MKKLLLVTLGLLVCNQAWSDETSDALIRAAREHDFAQVQQLIEGQQADVDATDSAGFTPLIAAIPLAVDGDHALVNYLIQKGAKVNVATNFGMTPLMYAAPDLALVQFLVEHGAQVDTPDMSGKTLLMTAVVDDNRPLAEYLIGKGTNVNATDMAGNTPLMFAASRNNRPMVEYLLEQGAQPEMTIKERERETLLKKIKKVLKKAMKK